MDKVEMENTPQSNKKQVRNEKVALIEGIHPIVVDNNANDPVVDTNVGADKRIQSYKRKQMP